MTERPLFSRDLRRDVAMTLSSYMTNPTPNAEDRVSATIDRVCAEARAMHLTVHDLARGLAQLYAELPGVDDAPRRAFYRYFALSCVKTFQLDTTKGGHVGS